MRVIVAFAVFGLLTGVFLFANGAVRSTSKPSTEWFPYQEGQIFIERNIGTKLPLPAQFNGLAFQIKRVEKSGSRTVATINTYPEGWPAWIEGDRDFFPAQIMATKSVWRVDWLRNRDEGIAYKFRAPLPILRLPLKPGISWSWTGTIVPGDTRKEHEASAKFKLVGFEEVDNPLITKSKLDCAVVDCVVAMVVPASPPEEQYKEHTAYKFWMSPKYGLVKYRVLSPGAYSYNEYGWAKLDKEAKEQLDKLFAKFAKRKK